MVKEIFKIFKKKNNNKYPTEEYLEKIEIFKNILKSNNKFNKDRIEVLSQLLFNQLNSKSYSESGKNSLLDSFIHRAETKQFEKIEMILTGKGIDAIVQDRKIVEDEKNRE